MALDLVDRGFNVIVGKISLKRNLCLNSIKRHTKNGLPIIACKQWTGTPKLGHFIVIIGVDVDKILYLDPQLGPEPIRKNIDDFVNEWKSTNPSDPKPEVIGGEFIIMGNQKLPLKVDKFYATYFNVPNKLESFCLNTVTFIP